MQAQGHEDRMTLGDGREVMIRPILPSDGGLLVDMFNRISPRTVHLRFLRNLDALPEAMVHQFTHIDYKTDFALVAVSEEGGREVIIAVARYAYDAREDVTDLALAVRDDWQNLGLGKSLLKRIITAGRKRGVSRFSSMMDPGNTRMEHILLDLGYEVHYSARSGFYAVEILV